MNVVTRPANSEARLRQEVAACTLILNDEGLMGYSGHVSARLPGEDAYLVQPIDTSRAGLKPDDLLVCDYDGNVLRGNPKSKPPAEVFLHGEILRARPDVNSVAHFHHDLTNVFTLVDGVELVPIKNHAIRWRDGIPVHEDPFSRERFRSWRSGGEDARSPPRDADPRTRAGDRG